MTSLRKQLIARVAKLGVEEQPAPGRDDGFAALCYRGKSFAHFHHDEELDLHLTRSVIAREGLVHPSNSVVHPKRSKTSHWIELRLKTTADLDHVTPSPWTRDSESRSTSENTADAASRIAPHQLLHTQAPRRLIGSCRQRVTNDMPVDVQ